MPYATSSGTRIYYEVAGEGPDILFAHGAGGNAAIWYQQVAWFSGKGFRCITFDHRTFARSPAPADSVSAPALRDDALAVLDAVGADKAHVVGQSMGGFTALRLALDAPHRVLSLTLSATPGGLPNPAPTESAANLTRSDENAGDGILRTMSRATLARPERVALYRAITAFNVDFRMTSLRALARDPVSLEAASALQCPVLFIAGAEDPLFPASLLASFVPHIPGARLIVVQDSGHSPYFEQPDTFNALLHAHVRGSVSH
ncbi:MAG: alpha/beta fold hydrolase [Pseudomonadales bacterium]